MLAGFVTLETRGQDRIVLRNTKVIAGRKVVAVDEDGIRLDGAASPQSLGWDEIESATVALDQAKFDQLLKELGEPLFRIRRQMTEGRYQDILPHAEAVFPRFLDRRTPTAYLVAQGLMWSLLAHNRREEALAPYLVCLDVLQANKKLTAPGNRRLPFDPTTGLSPELSPAWFDTGAAKTALPLAQKVLAAMAQPAPPAAPFYVATLALSAGEAQQAEALLQKLAPTRTSKEWTAILAAQREVLARQPGPAVAALEKQVDQLLELNKPLGWYWLGQASLLDRAERKQKEGVVRLLRLPAFHGDQAPDLAAASLYHAFQTLRGLEDANGSLTLRQELLSRFGQTYHGARLRAEIGPARADEPKKAEGRP